MGYRTGNVKSWLEHPLEIGPIYPFVGWESVMFLACVTFCVALMVWKIKTENAHYAAKVRLLKETGEFSRILEESPASETANGQEHGNS